MTHPKVPPMGKDMSKLDEIIAEAWTGDWEPEKMSQSIKDLFKETRMNNTTEIITKIIKDFQFNSYLEGEDGNKLTPEVASKLAQLITDELNKEK